MIKLLNTGQTFLICLLKIFPNSLKIAKKMCIHETERKVIVSNYKPISLLFSSDKIIEKLVQNKLIHFLEEKKMLYYKQFGFQKNNFQSHML